MLPSLHSVSSTLATAMVMGTAEGVALIGSVALTLRLCSGISSAVRSAVWTVALAVLVLLPAGALLHSPTGVNAGHGGARIGENWAVVLVGLWVLLVLTRLSMLAVGTVRLRQTWRRATPWAASDRCRALLEQDGRRAELCVSEDVDRPSVVGFFHPRVLFPASLLAQLGPEEVEHIIRHEMEHLRRYDDWINLLQKLSLAVFPLNPVLFWLDRQMCRERELACDDGVLRRTRARKAYAICLANLAETRLATKVRRASVLALGALGRETELSRRVQRILSWRESTGNRFSTGVVAGLLIFGVTVGGMELAQCPELLRFADQPTSVALGDGSVPSPFQISAQMQPRTNGNAVAVPVLARYSSLEGASSKPSMVKAVLREAMRRTAPARGTAKRRGPIHANTAQSLRLRKISGSPQMPVVHVAPAPRVVMTSWTEETPALGRVHSATRLVLTVGTGIPASGPSSSSDKDVQSFTAFVLRGGWLIVSL